MVEVPPATMADDDRGRGAGDPGHVVVLGQPVALVAPALGVLREIEAAAQSVARRLSVRDGRKVENRNGGHGVIPGRCRPKPALVLNRTYLGLRKGCPGRQATEKWAGKRPRPCRTVAGGLFTSAGANPNGDANPDGGASPRDGANPSRRDANDAGAIPSADASRSSKVQPRTTRRRAARPRRGSGRVRPMGWPTLRPEPASDHRTPGRRQSGLS